jgi:hypothetical protein
LARFKKTSGKIMKKFLSPNIDSRGRIWRGVIALLFLSGSGLVWTHSRWLAFLLLVSAVFVAFEALRGWCALRACGIKTKI